MNAAAKDGAADGGWKQLFLVIINYLGSLVRIETQIRFRYQVSTHTIIVVANRIFH